MQTAALDWLTKHHEDIVHGLAELVAMMVDADLERLS